MKKLIVAAVFILGGIVTASAQTQPAKTATKTETTTTKTETTPSTAAQTPQASADFKDVKLDALPAEVKTAVTTSYPNAVINSVQVNAANEYKLNLTVGDQTGVVYSDATGKWIKK